MRTREGSRGLQLKQGVFVSTATPLNLHFTLDRDFFFSLFLYATIKLNIASEKCKWLFESGARCDWPAGDFSLFTETVQKIDTGRLQSEVPFHPYLDFHAQSDISYLWELVKGNSMGSSIRLSDFFMLFSRNLLRRSILFSQEPKLRTFAINQPTLF